MSLQGICQSGIHTATLSRAINQTKSWAEGLKSPESPGSVSIYWANAAKSSTNGQYTHLNTHTHTCKHAWTHIRMETHRATKQALNDDNNIYATPQGHFRGRHLCARRRGRTTAADGAVEWGFLAAPCITLVATRLHTTQPALYSPSLAEFFTTWPQFVP